MDRPRPRWEVCPPIPAETLAALPHVPPLLAQLLYNRGIVDGPDSFGPEALERFLQPRWDTGLHDPFLMADMDRAVERVLAAVDRREQIGVFGHYDADGITALVLLTTTLQRIGAQVVPYMPSRADEYGVNDPGIADLASRGVRLLISVDCGIRSFWAPESAARHGMDVIITDHHTILQEDDADRLPAGAVAVLDPLRADCRYPCKGLAGVGVAFKLAQALLRAQSERSGETQGHFAKWLLDLVCLGTVADVSDITGENRALVHLGLELLRGRPDARGSRRAHRPGMEALLTVAGTDRAKLNVESIGFQLAPRINAAARLADPWTSVQLLSTADPSEALALARQLDTLNRERQRVTQQAMAEVTRRYGDTLAEHNAIVVDGSWPSGIIGLIAGKLCEAFGRPTAVVETGGGDELHGSARSLPAFHIADALGECSDLLSRFGGHAQAAGFALPADNLDAFRERLQGLADERLTLEDLTPTIALDAILVPEQVTPELLELTRRLEPCGPGNPPPLFGMRSARVVSSGTFGSEGNHLRLMLSGPDGPVRATAWRLGSLAGDFPAGSAVDLAFSVREDTYVASGFSLYLEDVAPSGDA